MCGRGGQITPIQYGDVTIRLPECGEWSRKIWPSTMKESEGTIAIFFCVCGGGGGGENDMRLLGFVEICITQG